MACSSADPSRAPSVGFLAAGWHPDLGGVETHTRALALELVAAGRRVEALVIDSRSEAEPYTWRDEVTEGVRVRRVAYRWQDHRALADLACRDRAESLVLGWVEERALPLVHVHHLTGFGASVPLVLRAFGVRVVMSLHDYWMLCPRGQMWHREGEACAAIEDERCAACLADTWPHLMPSRGGAPRGPRGEAIATDRAAAALRTELALEALGACDRLLVPSRAALEVFVRAGVPREKLAHFPNAVDSTGIARAMDGERARAGERDDDSFVLGVLGAVQPSKGVLELAHAVLATGIRELVLEVHGPRESYHGDRSYAEALEALAARDPRVRLMGAFAHDDLARVLARLDALAVPSRWEEVFGLSAREALAAGLPVLASRAGGHAELEAEADVVFIPAEDRAAWIEALRALVGRRTSARRSHWRSSLSPREHASELVRLYEGLGPVALVTVSRPAASE